MIGFFILLNLIFMSLESYQMSESMSNVVEASDFFFMFIFVTEAILRIVAVGQMIFYALHVKFVSSQPVLTDPHWWAWTRRFRVSTSSHDGIVSTIRSLFSTSLARVSTRQRK